MEHMLYEVWKDGRMWRVQCRRGISAHTSKRSAKAWAAACLRADAIKRPTNDEKRRALSADDDWDTI